jgi:multidrug efflux pump subunit AcrB/ABC-type multidrug transport system ATPase subunit
MLFISLTFLGYVSYKQLPVELIPDVELPKLYVQVSSSQDMDPAYVEREIIIPLEGTINAVGGVENIQSSVDSRQSFIQVDFKKNVNFKIITLKLQEKINETASTFPQGFSVQVQKVDLSLMKNTFMFLQVRGSGGIDRIRNIVEKEIRSDLENIDGIAAVNIYGGREKAIEIRLDPDACKALNLTPSQISNILSQNTKEKTFVGFINEPDNKYFVDVNSSFTKVSDLENIIVAPGPILLKDVATVFFELKAETSYSRVNGKESVSVSLMNDSQANLINLSHRTMVVIDKLNESLKSLDVKIIVRENTAAVMENNINQIIHLALVGGLLAILILWLFLKNIRLVCIIALSVPLSVYAAFNLFYAFDITVNSLTLIGIALAVGMLLDNSVVVLENIYRLSSAGLPPEQAVTQGTKEIRRSIFASTLTTATVFLPFVFSDNFLVKLLGYNVGIAIISTLTVSLFVALLFIPMATYLILKKKNKKSVFYEKISLTQRPVQIYLVFLKTCMRNPGVTVIGSILLLFVTLAISFTLTLKQGQAVDSDRFTIRVNTQAGSSLENTDKVVRVIEDRLNDFAEKEELICRIQEKEALLTFVLKKNYQKIGKRNIADIQSDVRRKISDINGAEIFLTDAFGNGGNDGLSASMTGLGSFMRMLGIGDNNERVVVKGSDFDRMQKVAEDIRYYLDGQDFIQHSNVSYNQRQPELLLNFNPILLISYDISRSNISSGLMSSLNFDISSGSSFKVGEETYDIIIRSQVLEKETQEKTKREKTIDDLRATPIQDSKGNLYQLKDLAEIDYGYSRSQIKRINQDKQIEVYYSFSKEVSSSKSLLEGYRADIDHLIAGYNLPAGVVLEVFHEEEQLADFKFLFLAAIILIFIILASVFESFTTPFALLLSIPLAATGSLLALLFTGNSLLNANSLTGFLILLGVVVNNSIILIDYANILRKQGYRRNRALMVAGLSRIRPILITSITTIVAMFPLAMGNSEYSGIIGAPFAITVIGGLSFSTLLTLILVPTACIGLENTLKWHRNLSLKIKLLLLIFFAGGITCILIYVEGLLWQSVYWVALIILIPALTYFTQNSLRRAKSRLIDPGTEIQITVRNLVKVYDRPGRFRRQWQSGLLLRKRLGISASYHSLKDFIYILWQFALLGFGIYFTFFFIRQRLWVFILSIALYAGGIYLWQPLRQYLGHRFAGSEAKPYTNRVQRLDRLMFWMIPLLVLIGMYRKMDNPALVITIGIIVFLCLFIYNTSRYLYDNEINIERVKGRFAGLRRSYFRLVKNIPLIGKQHKPFKALQGVSIEIKAGMFGLLGPNGSGKSTLMRIICGILEQSYGSIWINGFDTRIYREELQSQIGFLPQEFGTYENMPAYEFLDYHAILKGITESNFRKERIEYVLKAVHMYDRKADKIGSFSGGMKQRIGIALILLHLPRILIVDETTAGLDPRERIRFRNLLVELSKDRIVIFSTHIIEDISSSCNRIAVLDKGRLKFFGNPVCMVGLAKGKVWQFNIDKTDFENLPDKSKIIHHIRDGESIRVRVLSNEAPADDAVLVEPNLEDAYLCLLKG